MTTESGVIRRPLWSEEAAVLFGEMHAEHGPPPVDGPTYADVTTRRGEDGVLRVYAAPCDTPLSHVEAWRPVWTVVAYAPADPA